MIINSPSKNDFESVAKENLTQAFNLLYKVYNNYLDYDDEIIKEEVPISDIWEHHNGTLRTSLILLHQAIEGLMKAVICETSSLLLIDKPRKDWPTLPLSDDREFDGLYTIGGEALLTTFCAVSSRIVIDTELINFIEEIRQKRNQAIHGINVSNVTPEFLIENILKTFTIWFGKDTWLNELKENLLKNPLFGYLDSEFESAKSYTFLDFALEVVKESVLSKFLSIDIKSRAYFCPECKDIVDREFGHLNSKWAFLNPNEPITTKVSCVNCGKTFNVERIKCDSDGCKGNVIYNDIENGVLKCLTCFSVQEDTNEITTINK